MHQEEYLIHELAKRAGTTVRTIRYYTDEGLLPQPVVRGKYAFYTQEHLDRLGLIQRMKAAYLPLREIRETLATLNADEVRALVDSQANVFENRTPPELFDQPGSSAGASAFDYIARLVDHQTELRSPRTDPPKMNVPPSPAPRLAEFARPYPGDAAGQTAEQETWRRVSLAPGVELHLREPAEAGTSSRVARLVAFAQKLFRKGG